MVSKHLVKFVGIEPKVPRMIGTIIHLILHIVSQPQCLNQCSESVFLTFDDNLESPWDSYVNSKGLLIVWEHQDNVWTVMCVSNDDQSLLYVPTKVYMRGNIKPWLGCVPINYYTPQSQCSLQDASK